MGLLAGHPSPSHDQGKTGSKLDRYASESDPAWAREHRGKEWPDTVDELNKYIGVCDSLDSWGHPISGTGGGQARRVSVQVRVTEAPARKQAMTAHHTIHVRIRAASAPRA